eukprot:UN25813
MFKYLRAFEYNRGTDEFEHWQSFDDIDCFILSDSYINYTNHSAGKLVQISDSAIVNFEKMNVTIHNAHNLYGTVVKSIRVLKPGERPKRLGRHRFKGTNIILKKREIKLRRGSNCTFRDLYWNALEKKYGGYTWEIIIKHMKKGLLLGLKTECKILYKRDRIKYKNTCAVLDSILEPVLTQINISNLVNQTKAKM